MSWSNNSVIRLLINEIHLGYVIYGKTRNVRGSVQLIEKEDWIKVKGTHEPLKAEQEHDLILTKIAQNNIIPKKTRRGMLPLSGLLYCAKCGKTMQYKRFVGKSETYWNAVVSGQVKPTKNGHKVGHFFSKENVLKYYANNVLNLGWISCF